LRIALLDEIRRTSPFEAYAWLLTDPDTEVGTAPLADVPCLPELPRLIRLKYLTSVNRWTGLPTSVATLVDATDGRPERSRVWREMLAAHGVTDVASLVFRDQTGCWGFLDLWRTDASFGESEVAYLSAVAGPIADALRRCQARTFDEPASDPVRTGPVALVLSPTLEVYAQTSETDRYLRALVPTEHDRRPVPAGAYNVAAQLLAVEAGVDDHPPSARAHLAGGTWLTFRAARVEASTSGAEPDIAVTVEPTSPAERTALFARANALSRREAELVDHLVGGADTRGIAREMFLSEYTVQDHLKSIFAKTRTTNRRTLLARIVGGGR
jgi:DNA-binding NarL/FixJ family response regulator